MNACVWINASGDPRVATRTGGAHLMLRSSRSLAIIGTLFYLARATLAIEEWLISMVLDRCPAIRFHRLVD
ncbi:hypothetical protein RSO01_24580 [Reyranella soli]|uniref:Uncharacterized protein n=1 Tax=Reyranella soli TaxID=1230389 RepID=A0A512N8J6_9HYPH|nr:hypothetical protein RSO01_24580 [Reyranella soli]